MVLLCLVDISLEEKAWYELCYCPVIMSGGTDDDPQYNLPLGRD